MLNKAKSWKGPVKARRRVFIQEGKETDPFHVNFNQTYKRYVCVRFCVCVYAIVFSHLFSFPYVPPVTPPPSLPSLLL
ncbi:hypothetical protein EON63_13465 [archaeon]|nr:MAG: hypothetical protein EON63_13465 [archaeon]